MHPESTNSPTAPASLLSAVMLILAAAVLSRLALEGLGLLAHVIFGAYRGFIPHTGILAADLWGSWDGGWYMTLIRDGYMSAPQPNGEANYAFFPVFPMTVHLLNRLFGHGYLISLALNNLAFLMTCGLMLVWARTRVDEQAARLSVVLLCIIPGSFIFSSLMTESFFLFFVLLNLYAIERRQWFVAALAVGLASGTRNVGIFTVLPLIGAWVSAHRDHLFERRSIVRFGLLMALAGSGLLAFMIYLYVHQGDPLAFVHVQQAWHRHIGNPFAKLWAPFSRLLHEGMIVFQGEGEIPFFFIYDFTNALGALGAAGVLLATARSLRWSERVLVLVLFLVPLSTGLPSMARYVLVIPFLYPAIARLASTPARAALVGSLLGILNLAAMASFSTGRFFW